jgi:hypothetical protein
MDFCRIEPPTYGTGNATVRIISQKNTSTTSRSQSFTIVLGTGIRRTITVNQEGAKSLPSEWLINPIPSKNFKRGTISVSAVVSLKNVPNAQFGKPLSLINSIYSVNGEESGETYDITTFGFSLSSTIASVQTNADGGNTVIAIIDLNLDRPQAYEAAIDNTAYSTDEYGPYSNFIVSVGVQGMDGNYEYADWDITVYQEALNRGTGGEITLSPEVGSMGIEDSCTFDVTYSNIIPDTIHFVPGPEMENSDGTVYLDTWTPPSGSDPASGSFSFTIASNSEATTESYSFDVTGNDVEGTTYTASGSADIA